jgi:hypothetical protein
MRDSQSLVVSWCVAEKEADTHWLLRLAACR